LGFTEVFSRHSRVDAVSLLLTAGVSIFLATVLASCSHEASDASRLKGNIRQARQTLDAQNKTRAEVTYRPVAGSSYVVVFLPPQLPPQPLSKETIAGLDLPLEAREWLELEVKARSFPGPMLGFLVSKQAEWHPLDDIVSVPQMVYVWKKPGEEISVELSMRNRQIEISGLR
jgi:hypothetical protein